MKHIPAVYVEWEDHCNIIPADGGAWLEHGSFKCKPAVIKSMGFIVKETKKYLTICSCYDASTSDIAALKNVALIIKSCIIKRKNIK